MILATISNTEDKKWGSPLNIGHARRQDAPEMVGIIKSFEEAQGVHQQFFHPYIIVIHVGMYIYI